MLSETSFEQVESPVQQAAGVTNQLSLLPTR